MKLNKRQRKREKKEAEQRDRDTCDFFRISEEIVEKTELKYSDLLYSFLLSHI